MINMSECMHFFPLQESRLYKNIEVVFSKINISE
jgi:hypothetical protein